jgi:hypothetical protein
MRAPDQRWIARARAFCAALMLVSAWLSFPAALAIGTGDTCAMACCINEGHCCCIPSRPFVQGQSADDAERIGGAQMVEPCPKGCTAPQISTNITLKASIGASAHLIEISAPRTGRSVADAIAKELLRSLSSSPRAPPFSC